MEVTEKDFRDCKSISLDKSYSQPKIRMCGDLEAKQLMHEFNCVNDEAATDLFKQLLSAWEKIKKGMRK